ncbi:MAG TPA: ArgR family transcriptional regulator [Actinobacteria bacterium]|nr:ArgR family transcriptional regulator [Actinomycetota bacterium]
MTQATVSRDVADIGLKKNSAGNYVLAQEEELKTILKTLVKKVTYSANIVLINTLPAAGQTVASYLDKAKLDGVMGSVAGDDTIFLLVAEDHDAETITIELRALKED